MLVPNTAWRQTTRHAVSLCRTKRWVSLAGCAGCAALTGTPVGTTNDNANKPTIDLNFTFETPSKNRRFRYRDDLDGLTRSLDQERACARPEPIPGRRDQDPDRARCCTSPSSSHCSQRMAVAWRLAYGAPPPNSEALLPFHISPPAATLPGSFGPLAYEL